jgi:uncharacterized cupin superfamily protein|tara:strand:+ start:240 stop:752 length:513 start_codon:yes stop_codon:yes gene_type:complete
MDITGSKKPRPLISATEIEQMHESVHIHQFNDNAIRHSRSLGDSVGLSNIGIHLVRLEQGRESTQFHFHHCDEEFLYILSGSGVAQIGDGEHTVSAGDFMGFCQQSLPHSLYNPNSEELVYLMGGNRSEIDICDYPRINQRMYRVKGEKEYVDMDQLHSIPEQNATEKKN